MREKPSPLGDGDVPSVTISPASARDHFGSKKGLLIAALAPSNTQVSWASALEAGPDDRPIYDQLLAHAQRMSTYFHELQTGLSVLEAAGISSRESLAHIESPSAPDQAYGALVAWIERAQASNRLAPCDVHALDSTILGSLQGWAFTQRACGIPLCNTAAENYVERLIELLWTGVRPSDEG